MSHVFELFISKDAVTADDFSDLYTSLSGYLGSFKKIRFHILFKDNHIRYFIESEKDVSAISSSTTFCVLMPVDADIISLPTHTSKERFVNFVTAGTLLDLREKMSVKKGKTLEHFVCDVQRISAKRAHTTIRLYFENAGHQWSLSKKITNKFPSHLFAINFTNANNFMKSETPQYLNIEKVLHMIMPENVNALLEVNTFPYFPRPYFLPLAAYEFDKHSMIVGASGSGKSKFIELFIDRLNRMPNKQNYRIIVIDPHANLAEDLKKIPETKVIDFNGESTELFAGAEADITAATELTTTLMKSLMGDSFNPRVERVMRFSLFVLFTSQRMSLGMLKRFLTDLELRQQILDHVEGHVPHNISQFFATDFNEIRTAFYNEGLLPILAIIDELELQPTFLQEGGLSLQQTVNNNFLTVFSLNKVSMGEKVVKTVAGLLIQQIFLLAQSKAFNERVILFIDEVSVVQNPALASILSEARKFNLFVVLTQQYFAQVDKTLQEAIFANVYNYYCFRVAEEDAEQLIGNLPMELPKEILIEAKAKGIDELTVKKRMLTDLNPRECIVRVASNGLLVNCFKARTLDVTHNLTQTFVSNNYTPVEYSQPQIAIERFQEKPQSVSDLPIVDNHEAEPPPGKRGSPPLAFVQVEPILERGPLSLDEIMSQNSTKESNEQGKEIS